MNMKLSKTNQSFDRPSVISFSLTVEEQHMLKDLNSKFQLPWLQNMLTFNRETAVNLVNHVYHSGKMEIKSWCTFKRSMGNNFRTYILPRFPEIEDLDSQDVGQIMNSSLSEIVHFFRSSQAFSFTSGAYTSIGNPSQVTILHFSLGCV